MKLSEVFNAGEPDTVFLVSQDDGHLSIAKIDREAFHDIDLNDYDQQQDGTGVANTIYDYVICAVENLTGYEPDVDSVIVKSVVRHIATQLDAKEVATTANIVDGWFDDENKYMVSFFSRDLESEIQKAMQFNNNLKNGQEPT